MVPLLRFFFFSKTKTEILNATFSVLQRKKLKHRMFLKVEWTILMKNCEHSGRIFLSYFELVAKKREVNFS